MRGATNAMASPSCSITLLHLPRKAITTLLFASLFFQLGEVSYLEIDRDVFVEPKAGDKNIFFFEGTCARNSTYSEKDSENTSLSLDVTQACAVESTARANPEMSVFVFSSCPVYDYSLATFSQMVQDIIKMHKNVFVWHQSLKDLFENTALEDLFHSGKIFDSLYKTQASNVARILLLQKFGGVYLDLDFIARRPLANLAANFAGLEDDLYINSAAIGLSTDGVGSKVAGMLVEEIKETFDGSIWGQNGPKLLTRVLRKLCHVTEEERMSARVCGGFTIYEPEVFYAIHYVDWRRFYDEEGSAETLNMVENSTAVHLWNSMPFLENLLDIPEVFLGSNQPKGVLQLQYCPIAYEFNTLPAK